MFKPVNSKIDFPEMERRILAWWRETDMMKKYLRRNADSPRRFSFIDGPITANNPMGVHHAWGRTYKDLYQRYKTMQGFQQRYQNGFDGQGLWIEVEVEKELGFTSKRDIETFGIDKFVELCKERVRKFAAIQTEQSIRLGYWMDWDNSYHTMSNENNYTIWHFLKKCHERGWVYQGTDVMPWCPRCGTGLSEHEIVTEGYKEIVHPGLFVRFPLQGRNKESLLVWTTTPWTLAANTAAAVHPELTYARVRQGEETLYLLKNRTSALRGDYQVLGELPGSELVGLQFHGPFDELTAQRGVVHRVVPWEEVSEEEGTGIVHIAPGAGKEDFALGKEFGLSTLAPLDESGTYIEGYDWLTGQSCARVADAIVKDLKKKGVFYHLERYPHRYPVCWRCNTELVFRLVDEWFISMKELRHLIAEVTKKIRWIPDFGLQRELDWLANMDDWMISKKRYWGLALPIYKCQCGHFEVIGSEHDLKERAVEGWGQFEGHSPHRPWVDAVKIRCPRCHAQVSRIADVGNPWLDAGIVPFSTLDYRQNREHWLQWFPADWISECFPGQFRNWFYALLTMSTVLENQEPFRMNFGYALMRDEKGEEMHKSKGNAIWFDDAAERMGVDAMRWLFLRHNPVQNLNFGYTVADEVRRQFLIPLWNVYSFFVTYASIDRFHPQETTSILPTEELDRWITSELQLLIQEVTQALGDYDSATACRSMEQFVGSLSNWYVRRSRRRFWKSENDADKRAAYATLYECLTTFVRLLAPFVPFIAEEMYQNLVRSVDASAPESVHLTSFPVANLSLVDMDLRSSIGLVMHVCSLGRAARSKAGIKVRQPLPKVLIRPKARTEAAHLLRLSLQVMEELNVKELEILEETQEVLEYQVKPNLSLLGPKYGALLRQVASALASLDPAEVAARVNAGQQVQAGPFLLEPSEVLVEVRNKPGYAAVSEGGDVVAVTTEIPEALYQEGLARELVHRLQTLRREAGFDIADHIITYYQGDSVMDQVLQHFGDYIRQETLSTELRNALPSAGVPTTTVKLDSARVVLGVVRA